MKVLIVLVLAVVTGCQASLFYADEPKPQLEQLTDAFWDYGAKATHTAEDTLKIIRESQLRQEGNGRITEGANVTSQYAVTLQNQVSLLAQDLMAKITKEAEVLKECLEQDLTTVRDKLEPYAEDLKTQDPFDSEALKTIMLQKTEEIRGSLEEKVKELQSQLEPYTGDLRQKVDQHLQDFQKAMAPSPRPTKYSKHYFSLTGLFYINENSH